MEVFLASAMRLEGELQEELLLRSGSRCTRFQTMVSVPSTPQPALAMPIAGPASTGREIGDSIVRLLRLPVKDSGSEISPSGSHTQQSQHPWGGTAAASGLSSKRKAPRMAEPGGRMREGTAEPGLCGVRKALPSGATAQRGRRHRAGFMFPAEFGHSVDERYF